MGCDARIQDPGTTTNAANKPGGWQKLGLPHLPEWPGGHAHGQGPSAVCAPVHRLPRPSTIPRPGLRLQLASPHRLSRQSRQGSERVRLYQPCAPPLVLPGPLRPLPLGSAHRAPASCAPRLLGAEATPAAVS
ncbi:hypothetical protein HJG60_009756 [Phyllostomus discolor]|uniref:Uncharacterized protein n=1 Tax=Phyllostomus discolor TaxID=89673 RepID=A0A834BC56_9CHIR|nr:hypothetical protein HJG60_009756 [Phyllostomus discolor]